MINNIKDHYFHINNGGIIIGFELNERGDIVLFAQHTHFNIDGPKVEIPILTDDMAEFIAGGLTAIKLSEGTFERNRMVRRILEGQKDTDDSEGACGS